MIGVVRRDHADAIDLGPVHGFFHGACGDDKAETIVTVQVSNHRGLFCKLELWLGINTPITDTI